MSLAVIATRRQYPDVYAIDGLRPVIARPPNYP
jgi:hypothetical protein